MQQTSLDHGKITTLASRQRVELDERDDEHDLLQLLTALSHSKRTIFLSFVAAIGVCVLYLTQVATPLYKAKSVIALESRDEQVVELDNVLSGLGNNRMSVNTEVEVLTSRELIAKVVDELNLVEDPEFNPALREQDPWTLRAIVNTIFDTLKDVIVGSDEELPDTASPERVRDKVISRLQKKIDVQNVRHTFVFEIAATTWDRQKSATIANVVADLYIRDQIELKFEASVRATEWLTERVGELKVELETANNAVKSFNAGTELISPEALEALNRQLKDFRDRYANFTEVQAGVEQRLAEFEGAKASSDPTRMAAVSEDPAMAQMLVRLSSGSNATRTAFDNRFEQLIERARIEVERNATQRTTLASSIVDLEKQVAEQSAELLTLEQLTREAEASRQIYEHFLGRLKETSLQQGIQQADSRVLSRAIRGAQSAPRTRLMLILFGFIGVVIGTLIVVRDLRRSAFRTPAQLETETGIAVIGQIPRVPLGRRKRVLEHIRTKPTSAMAEAVRNLRTSILLSDVDKRPKVIMMTSSIPHEGKTTLTLSLSHNLAMMGAKVLVIEGDLRRRTFREFFDLRDKSGILSHVVDGQPLQDVLHQDRSLKVDVLFGERTNINAADFFSSQRFAQFMAWARDEYDYIIIDTPPVLVVPDARVIGQLADVVVYVVHWNSTPRVQVRQGIDSFAMVNVPVTGLVLSQIEPRGLRKYGYGSTYGYGRYQYSKAYYDK